MSVCIQQRDVAFTLEALARWVYDNKEANGILASVCWEKRDDVGGVVYEYRGGSEGTR